ncbi:nuclear transport factor 2 family protein [Amycolatopsis sp. NPDC059021]|uniref:nuclear transport factor 2 family protein n=1 Tax=Amycolatopsis sp. NPDC059021 TaxID=3346704 RepID=UPI003672805E
MTSTAPGSPEDAASNETNEERLAKLEARLNVLEGREAIREILYRYARGADRCDLALFKSCYWPDGTDVHWFFNGNAHEFADYVIPLLAEISNSQHSISNPIIDLHGDRAFVECQWYVVHHIPLEDGTDRYIDQQSEGRYLDVFENRGGEWRILHRQVVIEATREFVVPNAYPGVPVEFPLFSRRAPHDLVYQGTALLDQQIVPVPGQDLWGEARRRHTA